MKKSLDIINNNAKFDLKYQSIEKEALILIDSYSQKKSKKKNGFFLKLAIFVTPVLISFVLILVIILQSNNGKIVEINESISNLELIENDEERMLEIVKIDKQIKELNSLDKEKIDKVKLTSEKNNTSTKLKNSVEWRSLLNYDTPYWLLTDFFDVSDITKIRWGLFHQSIDYTMTSLSFFQDFMTLIDTAYIDIKYDDVNEFYDKYLSLEGINDITKKINFFSVKVTLKNSTSFGIFIHPNGRITVHYYKENENEILTIKRLISLITLDEEKIQMFFKFENLKKYYEVQH